MIDAAIANGGSYYLPYQIHATPTQFQQAYPKYADYFALKKRLDPDYRFRNKLLQRHYLLDAKQQAIANIPQYYRDEGQTFLTIPEWYLVFNPVEYADFLASASNPSDFPFIASVQEYWKLYDRVNAITANSYAPNEEYQTMLKVIGISTTVEYIVKSGYENTIGRLTRWTTSNTNTPEDIIYAQAQRAYSELIFDQAWYKFDFWHWVKAIWSDTDFFGDNFIRKLERKVFVTLEFGVKTLYAKLIESAVKANYEPSDGLIYLTVALANTNRQQLPANINVVNRFDKEAILSIPRWGEFTRTLAQLNTLEIQLKDISGNGRIAVSFISDADQAQTLAASQVLFADPLVSNKEKQRTVVMTQTNTLLALLNDAKSKQYQLEHIYDY